MPKLPRALKRSERGRSLAGGELHPALGERRGGLERRAPILARDLGELFRGRGRGGQIVARERDLDVSREKPCADQTV